MGVSGFNQHTWRFHGILRGLTMFKQHISWFNGILTVFTNKHVAFIRFSCVLVSEKSDSMRFQGQEMRYIFLLATWWIVGKKWWWMAHARNKSDVVVDAQIYRHCGNLWSTIELDLVIWIWICSIWSDGD